MFGTRRPSGPRHAAGMTPDSTLDRPAPADFLAAVPYLLGFHPADSVVVVGDRRPEGAVRGAR